jgi:hypothetical protein
MIPFFLQLARMDDEHYVTACRHGLVHLTWGRTTTRFGRDEFRQLADLMTQVGGPYPTTIRDGDVRITFSPSDDCEVQFGPFVLVLSPAEFAQLVQLLSEATNQLAKILSSGVWGAASDRGETATGEGQERRAGDPLAQLRRTLFSQN